MKINSTSVIALLFIFACGAFVAAAQTTANNEEYLSWTAAQAENIGKATREKGKAGSSFDTRIISTNKAINYSLRATLLTPEVIRATARVIQLRDRLTDDQTRRLVEDAENAGDLVIMIEINPNEGSGVVPLDWRAFLQPKGLKPGEAGAITGVKAPHLRKVPVMNGLHGRNYDYDVFWVAFPLVDKDKKALISPDIAEIQLIVGIYNSEGRISWRMPDSIKEKIKSMSKN